MRHTLPSSAIMPTRRPNLLGVLSETSRIISARHLHFLALTALFLLPISLASIVFRPTSVHSHYRSLFSVSTPDPETPPASKPQHQFLILYSLFVQLFSLFATASITYSAYHGFYGRPLKFISSLSSIQASFFPLLGTLLLRQILVGLIVFTFAILVLLLYALTGSNYESQYLVLSVILMAAVFVAVLAVLVQWRLWAAVVVLESKWGFAPLARSWDLVKGMRGVAFAMVLLFEIPVELLSMWYANLAANAGGTSWGLVVGMVVYGGFSAILSLYSVAANTVLFEFCKGLKGESAVVVAKDLGGVYLLLPLDDGGDPCVVNDV